MAFTIKGKISLPKGYDSFTDFKVQAFYINSNGEHVNFQGTDLDTSVLSDGSFTIVEPTGPPTDFTEYLFYYKIFFDDKLIKATKPEKFSDRLTTQEEIHIERTAIVNNDTYLVSGIVVDENQDPFTGTIKAYDLQATSKTLIGTATLDDQGKYSISYSPGTSGIVNLLLEVFNSSNELTITSPLFKQAKQKEVVNLKNGTERFVEQNEYSRVDTKLQNVHSVHEPENWSYKDVSIQKDEYGFTEKQINAFAKSVDINDQISTGTNYQALIYGLLHDGTISNLKDIVTQYNNLSLKLENAESNNVIPSGTKDENLDEFKTSIISHVVTTEKTNEHSILSNLDLSVNACNTLIEKALENKTIESLITSIDIEEGFTANEKNKIKNTIRASQVVLGDKFLVNSLNPQGSDGIADYDYIIDEIINKPQHEWEDLIQMLLDSTQHPNYSIPAYVKEGENPTKAEYADFILQNCERVFPTEYIITKWAITCDTPTEEFTNFLKGHSSERINIRSFDFNDANVPETIKSDLMMLQRLFKITPEYNKYSVIEALAWDDTQSQDKPLYTSATEILQAGMDQFIDDVKGSGLDAGIAQGIYDAAAIAGLCIVGEFSNYYIPVTGVNMNVFDPQSTTFESSIPDLDTLFSSNDYCSCKHCRSILSPAAYLVDTLQFLKEINGPNDDKIQAELFRRRPDIYKVLLNCRNTNVPIPYIDIVNEVLENFIKNYPDVGTPEFNTELSADEILTYPENLDTSVYDTISGNCFPWHLPFNLNMEEIRGYLGFVSLPRWKLMESFGRTDGSNYSPYNAIDIYLEFINIDYKNYKSNLETAINTPGNLDPYFNSQHYDLATENDFVDIPISRFLSDTGLELDDLSSLIKTKFINPNYFITGQTNAMQIVLGTNPCVLDEAKIHNMNVAGLDRLHRFVRLRNLLNWTTVELDILLDSVQTYDSNLLANNDFSEGLIAVIYSVEKLRKSLNIPLIEAISLRYDLSQVSYNDEPSIYDQIFNNIHPINPGESPIEADTSFNESWKPYLQACLRLDSGSIDIMFSQPSELSLYDNLIVVWESEDIHPNLSLLNKISVLCKSIDITISEFNKYLDLLNVSDPFTLDTNNSEFKIIEFINKVKEVKASGFSFSDIDYLLWHKKDSDVDNFPVDDELIELIETLHAKRCEYSEEYKDDLVPPKLSDDVVNIISEFFISDKALINKLISNCVEINNTKIKNLFDDEAFYDETDLGTDSPYFKGLVLLDKALKFIQILDIKYEDLDDFYYTINQLQSCLNLNEVEVSDEIATPDPDIVDKWLNLIKLTNISQNEFVSQYSLYKIIYYIASNVYQNFDACLQHISNSTGWYYQDLDFIVDKVFGIVNLSELIDLNFFIRFNEIITITKKIKASAETITSWNFINPVNPPYEIDISEIAKSIRLTVKSHYADSVWIKVAGPLRNELRERQLHALTAYLIGNLTYSYDDNGETYPLFTDIYDVYDYFLLDPEMSACAKTTRIKQAGLSVQSLMQRAEMNLEKDCTLTSNQLEEWEWMKNYRVWEANRKVFLYPENWLEPEFRMDKSPICKVLEESIIQNEINEENVSKQYLEYVEKFNQIANLEPVGMYVEGEEDEQKVVHIISRTRKSPHKYYYRRLIKFLYWTPWEEITVDIEGEYIIPVFWNNKFHLYWAIDNVYDIPDGPVEDKKTKKEREISFYWSCYSNGKWTGKSLIKENLKFTQGVDYNEDFFKNEHTHELVIWARKRDCLLELYATTKVQEHSAQLLQPNKKVVVYSGGKVEIVEKIKEDAFSNLKEDEPIRLKYSSYEDYVADNPWFDQYINFWSKVNLYSKFDSKFSYLAYYDDAFHNFKIFKYNYGTIRHLEYILPLQYITDAQRKHIEFPLISDDFDIVLLLFPKRYIQNPTFGNVFEVSDPQYIESASSANCVDNNDNWYCETDSELVVNGTTWIKPTVQPSASEETVTPPPSLLGGKLAASLLYHPHSDLIDDAVQKYGVEGLLKPEKFTDTYVGLVRQSKEETLNLGDLYGANTDLVDTIELPANFDFSPTGSYSQYNWELFFHIPMFIANTLANNGKHDEAMKWYHYIFNPSTSDPKYVEGSQTEELGPKRYWRFKPFYDFYGSESVTDLYDLFTNPDHQDKLNTQVLLMETDPFNPHIIAQFRIVAYMKSVVMKYLDNLISWGDKLFARDSMESINEATLLYILATRILGSKPQKIEGVEITDKSYSSGGWDAFANDMMVVEQVLAQVQIDYPINPNELPISAERMDQIRQALKLTQSTIAYTNQLYFCIQPNDKLLGYWNIVADRLFKIRHCMNIKGITRQLPMFEPPIDPGALIKAKAAGIDLSTALENMSAPMPKYRYRYIYQKATELTNEVKSLGAAILQAIEKRDGEELALIRSGHAIEMSKLMIDIREKTVEETKENIVSLEKSKESAEYNRSFYAGRIRRIKEENTNLNLIKASNALNASITSLYAMASISTFFPDLTTGIGGLGPHIVSKIFGGEKTAEASGYAGQALLHGQNYLQSQASIASINANFKRRDEDWDHQKNMADFEIDRIKKQIAASELRLAISENELSNLTRQIEQSEEELELMTTKFSNKELYNWMIGQLSNLYNQSYQMALNMAKQAERTYSFELDKEANFIGYEYWDSLKKGLLAGEKLQRDLHRMDVAFMENNERKHEITKQVTLALVNADALNTLRQTGSCTFDIPELLFDLDFPGHYNRKIKSVSLTIPAVTGPYTSPTCLLKLGTNSIRKDTNIETVSIGGQDYDIPDSSSLEAGIDGNPQFAFSHGQNDNGMFTFNFNDERFLPFEGAGAISEWSISLPSKVRQFDYETIADVILTINYTADYDGGIFKTAVEDNISVNINNWLDEAGATGDGLIRAFSLKAEFPNQLHELQKDDAAAIPTSIDEFTSFILSLEHFPAFIKSYLNINSKQIKIHSIEFHKKDTSEGNDLYVNAVNSDHSWGVVNSGFETASIGFSSGSELTIYESNDEVLKLFCDFTNIPDDIIMIVKFKLE